MTELAAKRRGKRIWLYIPFVVLALIATVWSIGWIVIRDQIRVGLDTWMAEEASGGRLWSCADRAFRGYPFRIEVSCSSFALSRPDVHAVTGRLVVVAQVYNPRHVIAEVSGPFRFEAGTLRADGNWRLVQASMMTSPDGIDRLSIVADQSFVTVDNSGYMPFDLSSRRFELHVKPREGETDRFDLAISIDGAAIPGLDVSVGGTETADFKTLLDITKATRVQAQPLASEMERWRLAGGRFNVSQFSMVKGPRRAEATGHFGIDDLRRLEGRVDMSAAGLGGLLGRLSGASVSGALLGALFGIPEPEQKAADPAAIGQSLKPLPPFLLQSGRLFIGPVAVPGLRLQPLY